MMNVNDVAAAVGRWGEWRAFDYTDRDSLTEKKNFTRKEKCMLTAAVMSLGKPEAMVPR